MDHKINYQFSARIWSDKPKGGWYFVTIPPEISKEIRDHLQWQEEGWGRMKASAKIKGLDWKTSIWFDSKSKNYLLPIKAAIRRKLSIRQDDVLKISLMV